MGPLNVVVVGGGIAGVETVLALHALAAERVRTTLVSDRPVLAVKALSTTVPFGHGHVLQRSLAELSADAGAELRHDALVRVHADDHEIEFAGGERLAYDVLVLATGAPMTAALPHVTTFGLAADADAVHGIVADIEQGYSRSVAFLVPAGVSWPLPAYELALMTAADVWAMGIDDVEISLVTPGTAPLAMFGTRASDAVGALLEQAGIRFVGGAAPTVPRAQTVELGADGATLHADRLIALPVFEGPRVRGVRFDAAGFTPVDDHGRVVGVADVYAAGDGTDYPIKQGGLAAQQADAVAEHIAARAGSAVEPQPFRPVLRGRLVTGRAAAYLENATPGQDASGRHEPLTLWEAATKVDARYLSAWLGAAGRSAEPGDVVTPVEVALPGAVAVRESPLALDPYSPLTAEHWATGSWPGRRTCDATSDGPQGA